MGSKVAPTYATLAALYLEKTKLYPKLKEQFAIENSLDINYK